MKEVREMRFDRIVFLRCVVLLTLALSGVIAAARPNASAPTEETQAQWKVVIPETLFAEKMRMAAFLDEKFGIIGGAGDPGKAHYSSDGGKTWAVADSSGG